MEWVLLLWLRGLCVERLVGDGDKRVRIRRRRPTVR
jgi:hypothetical protein